MATTTYTIFSGDTKLGEKSKKANALEAARAHRQETGEAVRVETSSGTVVFEQAAKKTIKMTPRYQRVVELPEGVTVPEGKRVAYVRPRAGLALLHDASADKDKAYSIFNLKTGKEQKARFATTREGGQHLRTQEPANA